MTRRDHQSRSGVLPVWVMEEELERGTREEEEKKEGRRGEGNEDEGRAFIAQSSEVFSSSTPPL